ncbi:hypothetical protein [uncultured Erythrobacter sp.]|uniref:DUF4870 family protein n=1 Tax=uncultured Erythrobacter sp. TaxID=263913 RepID=UPI0026216964|nr:hypothetical protein [uncultured Erythrobacter sp.]
MTEESNKPATTNSGPPANGGFDLNQPTIISLLYLGSFITGVSGLVGVILAHVWQGDNREEWAASHFTYLVRTFWIGFIAFAILLVSVIGWLIIWVPMIWVGVRSILSLIKAQKQEPMPDPKTLLF